MKKALFFLFLAFAVLTPSVLAQETAPQQKQSREHRGFYNSSSFGFGFVQSDWKSHDFSDGDYGMEEKDIEKNEFVGYTYPVFEFKFGVALANIVAFHTVLNFGFYSGTNDYFYDEYFKKYKYDDDKYVEILDKDGNRIYTSDWMKDYSEHEEESDVAVSARAYIGFGTTIYPFTNPNSVMNGAFIGGSIGYTFTGTFSKSSDDFAYGSLGNGFEVELGKDWWVNDHLSIGVGLTYGHSFLHFLETEGSDNVITLSFRLTRG